MRNPQDGGLARTPKHALFHKNTCTVKKNKNRRLNDKTLQ